MKKFFVFLLLLVIFSDFNWGNKISAYRLFCKDMRTPLDKCNQGTRVIESEFMVDDDKQLVVEKSIAGAVSYECSVYDTENWSCFDKSGDATMYMSGGDLHYQYDYEVGSGLRVMPTSYFAYLIYEVTSIFSNL